jgi:hypothetical protein
MTCADVVDLRSNTSYVATASGSLYTIAQGTQTVDVGAGSDLLRDLHCHHRTRWWYQRRVPGGDGQHF